MLERITPEERERFHKILDDSIDKMNSPKNSLKIHWSELMNLELQKMITVESMELDLAVTFPDTVSIESENYDLINLNMMMVDNLRGNI